jgi:hypothetical protein
MDGKDVFNKEEIYSKEGSYNSKFTTLRVILHGFDKSKDIMLPLNNAAMIVELQ